MPFLSPHFSQKHKIKEQKTNNKNQYIFHFFSSSKSLHILSIPYILLIYLQVHLCTQFLHIIFITPLSSIIFSIIIRIIFPHNIPDNLLMSFHFCFVFLKHLFTIFIHCPLPRPFSLHNDNIGNELNLFHQIQQLPYYI